MIKIGLKQSTTLIFIALFLSFLASLVITLSPDQEYQGSNLDNNNKSEYRFIAPTATDFSLEAKSKRLNREMTATSDPNSTSISEIKKLLTQDFQRLEAERTILLRQQERNTPNGEQIWYLVGIKAPTSSQIEEARNSIKHALEEVDGPSRVELDQWIGTEIDAYDLFGKLGKRAAIIQIPDDSEQRMVALVYTTTDFDLELGKLDPDREFSYTLPNLKMYFRDDTKSLMRFAGIIED